MAKQVNLGPFDATVSGSGGSVSLDVSLAKSLGGGQAADVLTSSVDLKLAVNEVQGANLAIALLEAHFPNETVALETVKVFVDAALAKVSV